MEAIKHVSIDYILEIIKRRNPWIDKMNYYDVCEYISEAYDLIGAPNIYIDQITGNSLYRPHVKVEDWSGELPPDIIRIKPGGVRNVDTGIVYRYATDSFHKAPSFTGESQTNPISDKTYSIKYGSIYINDQEATLQIAYKALPIDDKGMPLIADMPRFKKAIQLTILYHEAWKRYSVRQLARDIFDRIEQDYLWWIGSAESEAKMIHPDEAESLKNTMVRLYPKIDFHKSSFKFAGIQEDIKTGS